MLDSTAAEAILKVRYGDPTEVKRLGYEINPFLALVPKMEDFGGKNLPIPIQFGTPRGRSATFADAQANKVASKFEDFVLVRAKDYSLADLDNETMEASVGDPNGFLNLAITEVDSAIFSASRSLATALYRDGTGAVGSGTITTGVVTLGSPEDIVNFELGDAVVASATAGGALLGSGSVGYIFAIDRDAGTFTVATSRVNAASATAGTPASWTGTMFFHIEGDVNAKVKGLQAWLPNTAPGSTLFFGVNRSQDVTRLGGIRYDGSAESVEEALIGASARAAREGARPDHVFLNPVRYAELVKSLGSKATYERIASPDVADIHFRSVVVTAPTGDIKVVSDQNCPVDRAFMLMMSTWKFYSLGPAPKILMADGNRMLRKSDADAHELRVGYYGQLGCTAPGYNVNVNLGS